MNIRAASAADIAAMQSLIFEHGKNEWNYLPEDKIKNHLGQLAGGAIEAVLAEESGAIIGFATFHPSTHFNRFRSAVLSQTPHGYIHEVVVHRGHAGKGLGTSLLREAVKQMQERGFGEIYIDRHEENLASAGMMRKAGFTEIDTFEDPEHRSSGSRRTTVCRIHC